MKRSLRTAITAIWLASGLLIGGCGASTSVWTPDGGTDGWAAERRAGLDEPNERAQAHLDLAWACLLHARGCKGLAAHGDGAVRGAPDMALAQFTRALARQVEGDVGHRTQAWLDLMLWLDVGSRDHSPALDADLTTAAAEAISRLAVRDRVAVRHRLGRAAWLLQRSLTRGPVLHRWRRGGALAPLLPAATNKALAGSLHAPILPRLRYGRLPLHRRMYSGLALLGPPPWRQGSATVRALPLSPVDARTAPALRHGRHLLPAAGPGVFGFTGRLEVPRSGERLLVIRCRRPLRVWLDGKELRAPSADGSRASTQLRVHPVSLSAGAHRLHLAIGLAASGEPLDVALLDGGRKVPGRETAALRASWPGPARAVLAALVRGRGVASTLPPPWRSAPVAALLGLERPLGLDVHDRATEPVLDRVLDAWPSHVDARIDRAGRAREAGNSALARRMLAPLVGAAANTVSLARRADLRLEQAWQHLVDGLGDLALGAVEELVERQPEDCRVWRQAVLVGQDTLDRAALRRLLKRAPDCPDSLPLKAEVLALVGRLDAARRTALVATAQPAGQRAALTRARRLSQTLAVPLSSAVTAGSALVADEPVAKTRWRQLQRAISSDDATAIARLRAALLLGKHRDMELRRQAWQVGARLPWPDLLVDGRALAGAHAGSPPSGAPLTWLLDQEIAVLLPGGGALRRVHQVVRVHTVKAAEAVGEIRVPPDSELIFARTIAADGRVVLPAETPDKETVSLRQVGPGAVVEYAQVQFVEAEDPATGATRLAPFIFRSTDGPVLRSEYVVMAAPGPGTVRLDASPSAPKPKKRTLDGWRQWTFRQPAAPRARSEPRAQRPEWQLPMVRTTRGAGLDSVFGPYNEALAAYDRADDALLAPWRARARAAGHDVERWRQLVAGIAANVEQKRLNLLPGHPAAALRNRSGDRASLLYHLARGAGLDVCLARLVPLSRQPAYGAPDPRDYRLDAVVFRLPGPRGAATRSVWFDPGIDGGLVDFLRPGLRRRPGLLLGCTVAGGDRRMVSPDLGSGRERRQVKVSLDWHGDGRVEVKIVDTLRGAMAALVRTWLRTANAEQRTALLRHLASASLPGYELIWGAADDVDDDRQPLVLRYQARAVADPARVRALDIGLFSAALGRAYAALPRRRTAMRFGQAWDVQVQVQVRNHGPALGPLPEPVTIDHALVVYRRSAQGGTGGVVVKRHLRSKMGVVPATDYPALATRLRKIDQADHLHLERPVAVPPRR